MINLFELVDQILLEASAVPFKIRHQEKNRSATYYFTVDEIDMVCDIFNDNRSHQNGEFEVSFSKKGSRSDHERVGKDLRFLNTVLATVSACVKDFIEKNDNVQTLSISGARDEKDLPGDWNPTARSKAYFRFIERNFPEYKVTAAGKKVKVIVRDKVDNQLEDFKSFVKSLSNEDIIEDRYFIDDYSNDSMWTLSTDAGVNKKHGSFNIEVSVFNGDYDVYLEFFDSGEELQEDLGSYEELKAFLKKAFS